MKNVEELVFEGFTRRFAERYINTIKQDNDNAAFNSDIREWAHTNGFFAECASVYDFANYSMNDYLNDYEYYRLFPLNAWQKIWVNDKLTLKYMLADTPYGAVMPKYYYYMSEDGLKDLLDNPYRQWNFEEEQYEMFIHLLKDVGEMACKPCNGAAGKGFFKLSYYGKDFCYNEKIISENELGCLIKENVNYLFTEYIHPVGELQSVDERIHTLRIVTANESGNKPVIIGGYLRFSNGMSEGANYLVCENKDDFNIFCDVDFDSGEWGGNCKAKKVFLNHIEDINVHPTSKVELHGEIDKIDEIKKIVFGIAERFSCLEYLGFDLGITEDGVKLMEINTHPGIKYMQIFHPLLQEGDSKEYFTSKIRELDEKLDNEKRG